MYAYKSDTNIHAYEYREITDAYGCGIDVYARGCNIGVYAYTHGMRTYSYICVNILVYMCDMNVHAFTWNMNMYV